MTDYAGYVQEFYELFVAGKMDEALEMVTEDVEWRAPNCLPYGGVYHGRQGIAEYTGNAVGNYEYITVEVEDAVEAAPGRVITTGTFGGKTAATQTEFEVPFCQIWEFRDGKGAVLEYWNDSGAVLRALGIGPTPAS